MNAITTVEPATLLNIVARAATDPSVDVGKLQALIELQERVMRQQAKQSFTEALTEVARELEPVKKDASNPQFQRKYASLAAIDAEVRPVYTKHGFSVRYGSEATADGRIVIACTLAHRDGHSEILSLAAPPDMQTGARARTPVQAVGSSVSYLKRYLISMVLNITFSDEDDDGEASRRTAARAPAMAKRREPSEPVEPSPPEPRKMSMTAWLDELEIECANAETEEEAMAILNRQQVMAASEAQGKMRPEHCERFTDILAKMQQRVWPRDGRDESRVEIAGEEYLGAGH